MNTKGKGRENENAALDKSAGKTPDTAGEDIQVKDDRIPDTYIPDEVPEITDGGSEETEPGPQEYLLQDDLGEGDQDDEDSDSDDTESDDLDETDDSGEEDDSPWESHEMQIDRAVIAREKRADYGMPDQQDLFAMEEPLCRLMGATVLFYDLATALGETGEDARTIGLIYLSQGMKREADRLFRLYHGHRAQGS